jgi:uncharacterized protein YqhQ
MTIYSLYATKTTNQALANHLIKLLDQDGLRRKIIAYVKDEGSNLNVTIIALRSIMRCEVLGLDESFQDSICFGHVLKKTC